MRWISLRWTKPSLQDTRFAQTVWLTSHEDILQKYILPIVFCFSVIAAINPTYGDQSDANDLANTKSSNGTYTHEDSITIPIQTSSTKPMLPDWVKSIAKLWIEGQISDEDFLASIQQIIEQKILNGSSTEQPKTLEGFSNTQCNQGAKHVEMIGKYTNGNTAYQVVALRMVLLDTEGEILATGSGTISNIGPHETRYFNVITRYDADYVSCHIQVESTIPK